MKNLILLLFLLPLSNLFAQYKIKTIAEDEHLKVQLRYKSKIAFNERNKDLFTFIVTNKSNLPLKIAGVSWNLDEKNKKKYKDYAMLNSYSFERIIKREEGYIDTILNVTILPKSKQISRKLEERIFYFNKKDKMNATSRLGVFYQLENKDFILRDTVKNIKFELIAFDNYSYKQMADSVNNYLWHGKKDFATVDFLTNNPQVWDYINVPRFIAYLCSDTIKVDKKHNLFSTVKAMPTKYVQERQSFHLWMKKNIINKDPKIFHDLYYHWNDEFLETLLKTFDSANEDLYCYAKVILRRGSNQSKVDSTLDYRLYEILNQKKEIFFLKYKTKKDSLEHINEWMQILSISKSKYIIPYLKTFLGDTSKVLDADYIEGVYNKSYYCLYRSKPQICLVNRMVCPPEPETVEQFALDAIYKLEDKTYCSEIRDAIVDVYYQDKNEDFKIKAKEEISERFKYAESIKNIDTQKRHLAELEEKIKIISYRLMYDDFERNTDWQQKQKMFLWAAHSLALKMLEK